MIPGGIILCCKVMPLRALHHDPLRQAQSSTSYLIKEVLHQLGYPNVIKMPVHKQHLLQVLELRDCIVTVPGGLPALLPNDT